jgi:hypothetical protein
MTAIPFSVAITVAFTTTAVPDAEAVKLAPDWPAMIVTLEGTITVELLLESATSVPPAGAATLMVTVQVEVPGPVIAEGLQPRPVACNCCCCGDTVSPVVAVVPFSVAIRVAFTTVAVLDAEAVKLAPDCPARTVTLEGTITVELLLESAISVPPAGAAPLMVTVQVEVPGPVIVEGLQPRPVARSCC